MQREERKKERVRRKQKEKGAPSQAPTHSPAQQVETIFSHQSVTDKCCLLPALLSQWHIKFILHTVPLTLFSFGLRITSLFLPRPKLVVLSTRREKAPNLMDQWQVS